MASMLHVGNLSLSTTDKDLVEKFAEHGRVESVTLARDCITGTSKRTASVIMASDNQAQAAINWLHLAQFHDRIISVTRVQIH